jgi:hypothetical protein
MKFEVYKDVSGAFRWRLRNATGAIISLPPFGSAPGMRSPTDTKRAKRNVQAALAEIYDAQAGHQ